MLVLRVILIIIEILCSVLLIGIILLQKAKDEGLGLAFGQGVGETLFGSRAGNVLTKITIGLAIVFIINTLLIGVTYRGTSVRSSSLVDRLPNPVKTQQAQPAAPVTGGGEAEVPPLAPSPAPSTPAPVPEVPVSVPAPAPAPSGGTP
jgi:preprotein translocase subunit SecG